MQVKLAIPLNDTEDFGQVTAGGRIAWSYAEHRELLIVNRGIGGQGFSVCRSCGAATLSDPTWLHQAHDRPFLVPGWIAAPRKCSGLDGIWHGYLGHTFHSDLLLLRFLWPKDVAFQLGHPWMRRVPICPTNASCWRSVGGNWRSGRRAGWSVRLPPPGSRCAKTCPALIGVACRE